MKPLVLILFGGLVVVSLSALSGCMWGFSAQKPSDYALQSPKFNIRETLAGTYLSEGLIYDYTGRVVARFTAEMTGEFNETGGVLREYFVYASGRTDRREWTLTFTDDTHFTATAPDIVGVAKGEQSGNTLKMTYKLRLADDAGGHVLSVTDWMYLTDTGTVMNRSQMRKFGVKVAELVAVFKHKDLTPGELENSSIDQAPR